MELKVWVDGVQRVVCGVTEATTCQEVVIALAQAIGECPLTCLSDPSVHVTKHQECPQGPTSNLPDSLTSAEFRALCSSVEASVAASVRASIADTVRTAVTDAIVPLSSSIDALRATVEAQGGRLKDVESGLSEYSDRLVRLEDTVSHLVKDNSRLRDKLDDLEFRSRRNNVRILNVPEKMELDDALTFVSSLLLEVLGPSGMLSSAPKLDRAHRLGSLPDDPTNARPRPLICCLHDFQDRERILRRRDKAQLFFRFEKIFIFPDMISSEKRATFLGVKRQLYDRKVRFSLRHPARLHVEHSGERLVFDSAGEAQKWRPTCASGNTRDSTTPGRTGRYTLMEKWRDTERHLAPHESPVASLNTWGQYAGDVQLILHRTGPSLTERPPSEGPPLWGPERGPHRQSLPPLTKLRHPSERSLRRREPRRKSLTFTGGPRGLRDILSGGRGGEGREAEAKRRFLLHGNGGNQNHIHAAAADAAPGGTVSPSMWAYRMEDLIRLVGLQRETLGILEKRLETYEAELQTWGVCGGEVGAEEIRGHGGLMEDIVRLERRLRKNQVEMEEEEFWASELQIEMESERQLQDRLEELRGRLQGTEVELGDRMALVQGVEAGLEEERLHKERQETQRVSEAEARGQMLRARMELKAQERQTVQLESSCRAVDRSLGQSCKRLQDMQYELEQLTKELRQVNLQQFIQQTGTKVTVLPAEPTEDVDGTTPTGHDLVPLSGSLKRPVPSHQMPGHLRVLHSPLTSGLNPEGIYV
ncbi:hypothetical protein DPEC_G00164760 [Dallia pectoralis]|uniref:Uncharacterized protein n=1 Tax=Dallia pectoralis TaxID=75939 RepID=A0ACC2GH70_DALPE|nr:hypothetical protein DPEC_G00164760 [Dallia pectoralis]